MGSESPACALGPELEARRWCPGERCGAMLGGRGSVLTWVPPRLAGGAGTSPRH